MDVPAAVVRPRRNSQALSAGAATDPMRISYTRGRIVAAEVTDHIVVAAVFVSEPVTAYLRAIVLFYPSYLTTVATTSPSVW